MKAGMTEFEEKIIRSLLYWDMTILRGKVQAKWHNPCAFPPIKLCRTHRRIEPCELLAPPEFYTGAWIIYDMTCGDCTSEGCVPEAFVKVMDDIENGKILQSDADPNLRIEYIKSYEAYKS